MINMEMADCRFTIDRKSRVLTMTEFQAEGEEQSVTLEGDQMAKLLRYIVHILEIFMWEQDYSLRPDEGDYDPFFWWGRRFFHGRFEEWIGSTVNKGTREKSVMSGAGGIHKPYRAGYLQLWGSYARSSGRIVFFPCWNILSRRMRSFNGKNGVW